MSKDLLAQLFALNDAAQSRDDYVRAPFGYPGGKSRSIEHLLEILPYRSVFVDACAGSGAVLLARRPCKLEVFNDRCSGITAFFRAVRDPVKCKQLIERLELTVCSREEFIWARESWDCDWLDDVERAARWYYCIQNSFGSKGWQFGRSTSNRSQAHKMHNNLKMLWPASNRLRSVYIENLDWRVLMNDYNNERNGDDIVWYIDPPYWKTTNIYNHEFKPEHHYELAERCMGLNGFVALSGYDHPNHPYNKFKWTDKRSWEIRVSITGLAFHETNNLSEYEGQIARGAVMETVWIKDSR